MTWCKGSADCEAVDMTNKDGGFPIENSVRGLLAKSNIALENLGEIRIKQPAAVGGSSNGLL